MDDPKFNNAEVWLMLLKEGGRWTASEVAQVTGQDQTSAASNLRSMHEFGTVQRWEREKPGDRVRFGVTPDCKVPRGVTIADILACDLAKVDG